MFDFLLVFQLVILEGLLSFDNSLALASLVSKRLSDPKERKRALTYGIFGAYFFRIIIIFIGAWLMKSTTVKLMAGGYLVWLAIHELFFHKVKSDGSTESLLSALFGYKFLTPFWSTVVSVELMDMMFSIDSIGVALALSSKVWVLITGAVLGIIMMRFAASIFIRLIERFPILNPTAFVLVLIAGMNIILHTFGYGMNEHILPIVLLGVLISALSIETVKNKLLA